MAQIHTIDARGLACPQPVINIKKALDEHDSIIAIVDNESACGNIIRMADGIGFSVTKETNPDGIYLTLFRNTGSKPENSPDMSSFTDRQTGPIVMFVSQDKLGKGDDALGDILIKSFFHTIAETEPTPDYIIFINTGVKLAIEDSEILIDLKDLENKGTKILCCGTCLNYFNIKDKIKAGTVSNMYEIKDLILSAGRLISI